MSINVNDKNLGHATAYAYYKAGGGTMTEAEFTEFMADFGTASQTAVEAAQAALASKNAAQTAATTATNKASEATTAATTATNKAAEAQADADAAALDASQAMSAASTATTKATEATTAAATATSAKTDAVAANTAAQSAKTAAQTAQAGAETAAASVQSSAAQIATNAADISQLKSELSDLTDGVADIGRDELARTMSSGYCISSDGTVTASGSQYYVSNLVDISDYTVLEITARANWTRLLYAFYDQDEQFISGKASNNGDSSTQITDEVVRVPSGAKYIRASASYNITPYVKIVGIAISVKGVSALDEKVNKITSSETYITDSIESVTYESGYVNKNGASGSGNYVHTNKIPVNEGDRLYLVYRVSGNLGGFRFVTAYNAGGSAVFASGAESTGTGGYTVPSGIVSVILSISGTDTTGSLYAIHIVRTNNDTVLNSANKADNLFGKKWCVCGDSFSYGGQNPMPVFSDGRYKGSRKVYPYFIGNRTHINIVDFTGNGRTLAYPSDGSFSNSLTNPNADYYYQNIPSDVDYITIYLGINDSHHASGSSGSDGEDVTGVIPIGTVDDTTTATFGGAWNVVLSWLITNRPKAHIGIIVSNGVDNVAYRNMTIAIAKKYGLAYLDLNGDDRTPAMIRTVNPDIAQAVKTALINKWAVEVGVNTHPNTDAHEYESYFIENFLRSI